MNKSMLALVVMLCLVLNVEAQDAQYQRNFNLLQGEWVLDLEASLTNLEPASQDYYQSLDTDKKDAINAAFRDKHITFHSDGRYGLETASMTVSGNWELLSDSTTISIYIEGMGDQLEHKIDLVTDTELVLILHEGSSQQQLFSKWYLTKVSN